VDNKMPEMFAGYRIETSTRHLNDNFINFCYDLLIERLSAIFLHGKSGRTIFAAILILKSNKWYRQKQSFKQATKCAPASATASQRSEYIEYLYSKYLKDGRNLEQKFSTSEREPNKNW